MANEELAQTLDRLHQQLSQNPQLDEANLRSLRLLLDEIQTVCAQSGTATPSQNLQERSLNQRLQEVIEDFELRHPQLTTTLSQIADRLSDMGI
jgi:hypothetical protein